MTKNVMLVGGLFLVLLLTQPRPVEAQMQIGLSAGKTFATLEGDDAEGPFGGGLGFSEADLSTETGFFAGASVSVPLGGILSVSPGLYFAQKGTSFVRRAPRGDIGLAQRGFVELSYIEIPVTLGVAVTGADRPFGMRLFAGSEIAFEIDCELETFGPDVLLSYAQFDDCHPPSGVEESERKSVDLGLVFGADISYGRFFVRGGLDTGLTSLDDSDANEDFRNSAWFLGAGIVIGG